MAIVLSPKAKVALISRKIGLLRGPFFGRAAGTAIGFVLGEYRGCGFALEFPEKIASDHLEKLAHDSGIASASSSQSLENSHRVLR
ncbi:MULTISPECIES: hypothetical protein [unclassified Bradyrhizobium]|uniref:hypothetical protein n=1 Tax=unclassified Bradyrhizobium TaxID=2631580 RepID=UPI002FF307F3